MSKRKIVLTGGGTVGHVTLNLLLIPKLIQDGWEIHYLGDKHGIEFEEIQRLDEEVTFHAIATGKLRRYFSWQNVWDVFKVGFGVLQSLVTIVKIRPEALFSKGGFVSVPPVIAAKLLGVPVFIHESDLSMGLANKIAYKFATKMYTTFEQDAALTKAEHIGAITKVEPYSVQYDQMVEEIKEQFDDSKKTLLFVGGSAGAKVFNDFITEHLAELTTQYNIINISGDSDLNSLNKNVYRVDYVTDLYQPLMNLADLVVTRGGSNTIFELVALQKLHLIIPLGKEASRGDQLENAAYFQKRGYALQLAEEELSLESLNQKIQELLGHASKFEEAMKNSQELTSQQAFYHELTESIKKAKG
ncbi:UDP-N-acetylglucosamine--N-acetylmuramyl-(pentapeptide) pyrophosphoryl-undecaprenol N-acetylglucosamine transferase [Streptococcus sp. ZJ151]|uniref:UDP-N-acetylglucosamine--N-acetylmuramyl- (pentapeptide) pyrophosphoryl-undecaprenol N-acetylglucosamine transferase n=1 Tax=Streptococcus jiangjianxini TaxID=3161189 RepID=UPI0032EA9C8C